MSELVIFDLDGTIIKGQSQHIFLKYLFEKRVVGLFFYIKITFWFIFYKLGLVGDPKGVMEYVFSFLKGMNAGDMDEIIDSFLSERIKEFIFPEIIDIINKHKAESRGLVIVSNSPDIFVKKIAGLLGIENYIATRLEIVGDKFAGKILGDIVYGKNKVNFAKEFSVKNNFDLSNSYAYADHISDLDLLLMVSKPCAVNPDKLLLKEAKKRNWPVLIFKK